jgi:hypothetical protein
LILNNIEVTAKKALAGSTTTEVAFVDEIAGLVHIFDGNTARIIWRRRMQEGMQSWLGEF